MSTPLRRKRGNSVVWAILALVMVGLGGYGATQFSGGNTELGHVGDRKITVAEYGSTLRRALDSFSAQLGQPMSFAQAQSMGIDRSVMAQIVSAATLENEAAGLGLSVGDAQVRDRITSSPALQGADGKFSRTLYSQFLQNQGFSETEFEKTLRHEAARTLLQGAVLGGVKPADALVDRLTGWAMETRAFTFAELLPSDLPEPVAPPAESDLKAWYDGHQDAYQKPETRKLSYVWLRPESLSDKVEIDEDALKKAYESRTSEFLIPERRLVARLVYPTGEEAAAAKARLDKGEVTFEDLAKERGLNVEDTDLGEMARDDLGAAADAVFALTEPGVVGPVDSDLGPALFAMNGILQAQETTFEEARDDLRAELALDRARRMVADQQGQIEDLLASGAPLADVAKETGMDFGQMEFNSESEGDLAGYENFREVASAVTADSFPTLEALDDGGVFAIQLDGIVPAAVRPFDEVRDRVTTDWQQEATHKALLALAGEEMAQVENGATLENLGLVTTRYDDFARDGFVADAVPEIGKAVFGMTAGTSQVVDAAARVFLVSLTAINPADKANPDVAARRAQLAAQLGQSLGNDVFEQFTRAAQAQYGLVLNEAAVDAVNAQMR